MSTHKYIDRICLAAALLSLLVALLFVNGEALGLQPASRVQGYETRLFDTARVHTIDIVMDGWDDFIETCENEEYAACAAAGAGTPLFQAFSPLAMQGLPFPDGLILLTEGADPVCIRIFFAAFRALAVAHIKVPPWCAVLQFT